jgi:hypothetical protein
MKVDPLKKTPHLRLVGDSGSSSIVSARRLLDPA